MAGRVTFRIVGDIEMRRTLARVGQEVQNKAQLAAVLSGAFIVVNDAKRRAPIRTGTLRRSIHIGGGGVRNGDFMATPEAPELPSPERRGSMMVAFVGTNLDYASFQEFGTSRMDPRPFLRPALDENQQAVMDEMADVIREVIAKAV